MPILEQEDTMKAIAELTLAAVAVAFLVAAAFQIDNAHARSHGPVIHESGTTSAAVR
jgi:hypothetical protein